jgi:hypothetical protein
MQNYDLTDLFRGLQNHAHLDDFEGFTPNRIDALLWKPFSEESPVTFNRFDQRLIPKDSFVNHLWNVLELIKDRAPVKLTSAGYLPVSLCREIFDNGWIEEGPDKRYYKDRNISSESKILYITLMREILLLMKYLRKYKGEILPTKKANTFLDSRNKVSLYLDLFEKYCMNYNWGYSDGYADMSVFQTGFGFTLYLLYLHGNDNHEITFYFENYIQSFPMALEQFQSVHHAEHCFKIRMFDRFLERFGLVDKTFIEKRGLEKIFSYTRSELFNRLIELRL